MTAFSESEAMRIYSVCSAAFPEAKSYITPYKKRSDYDIDTFMAYEASVYKNFLYDNILAQAHGELADFPCCAQILQFLGELNAIDPKYVPSASMIREFIGGSELKY